MRRARSAFFLSDKRMRVLIVFVCLLQDGFAFFDLESGAVEYLPDSPYKQVRYRQTRGRLRDGQGGRDLCDCADL
jgi:hypothetical protein